MEAGSRSLVSYTNLPPGDYTFRVKAVNSDGVWNEEGASLAVTILPPWWRGPTCSIDLAYHGKRAQVPDLQVAIKRDLGADAGTVEIVPQGHGGTLTVESIEGEGATFIVMLHA